jgi:hypothetical protein
MAGWTHYIAFDLLIARAIVFDSLENDISHIIIIPIIFTTLILGPVGLVLYASVKYFRRLRKQLNFELDIHSILYVVVLFLSAFMTLWIFIYPASSRFLRSEKTANEHKDLLIQDSKYWPTPHQTVTKYFSEHLVIYLHVLPAGVWILLIPLQLLSPLRRTFFPAALHKCLGYIFFMTVPLITIGVFLIFYKKLDYEYDYPENLPKSNFSEFGLSPFKDTFKVQKVVFSILTIYFMATAGLALKYVREKKYSLHFYWLIRHISSGIWVALMRLYLCIRHANTVEEQRASFYDGSIISAIVTIAVAELYISYLGSASKYNDKAIATINSLNQSTNEPNNAKSEGSFEQSAFDDKLITCNIFDCFFSHF